MSDKNCCWCGRIFEKEEGTVELRMFYQWGKDCLYFCDEECMIRYILDKMKLKERDTFEETLNREAREGGYAKQNSSEEP